MLPHNFGHMAARGSLSIHTQFLIYKSKKDYIEEVFLPKEIVKRPVSFCVNVIVEVFLFFFFFC